MEITKCSQAAIVELLRTAGKATPAEVAISEGGEIVLRYEAENADEFDQWEPLASRTSKVIKVTGHHVPSGCVQGIDEKGVLYSQNLSGRLMIGDWDVPGDEVDESLTGEEYTFQLE